MRLTGGRPFAVEERSWGFSETSIVRFCSCVVISLVFVSIVYPHGALTKVSPDSVEIRLVNGVGSVAIFFNPKSCTKAPQVQLTDAMGTTNAIPKKDIHFNWETHFPNRGTLAEARIDVNTQGFVFPNTEYKGQIFFIWEGDKQTNPQVFDFTVVDRSTVAFELLPEKSDVMVGTGRAETIMIRLKNTGTTNISSLSISSLDLADGATQHRTVLPTVVKNNLAIDPQTETVIAIDLPKPVLAGTYSGVLDVQADGKARKSVLLTLRTRGPNYVPFVSQLKSLSYLPWLPLVLFMLTVFLGFGLSKMLENWFGLGGLDRAEAILSLRQSRNTLDEQVTSVLDLRHQVETISGQRVPSHLAILESVLRQSHERAAAMFAAATGANAGQQSLEVLSVSSRRFKNRVASTEELLEKAQLAIKLYGSDGALLDYVIGGLDAATPLDEAIKSLDREAYRNKLDDFVRKAGADGGKAAAAMSESDVAADSLKEKIRFMDWLHRLAVWIVVIIIAYQTFYANNLAFGALLDYLAVFLWSFGLTQAGTQIVARVRSARRELQT
jgi:hypothetical protein